MTYEELIDMIEGEGGYWSIRKSQTLGCYSAGVRIGDPTTPSFRRHGDNPKEFLSDCFSAAMEYKKEREAEL